MQSSGVLKVVALVVAVGVGGSLMARQVDYSQDIQRVDSLLQQGEYEAAEKESRKLLKRLVSRVIAGSENVFGSAAALHGVALAGTGDLHGAQWYWSAACQLQPSMARVELATYGRAGAELAEALSETRARFERAGPACDPDRVTEPRRMSGERPRYPLSAAVGGQDNEVEVTVVIDVDGRCYEPRLGGDTAAGNPSHLVALLQAMRTWTFEPCACDGEPVPSLYTMRGSFEVR